MVKQSTKYVPLVAAVLTACSNNPSSFELQELISDQQGFLQYTHHKDGPQEIQLYFESGQPEGQTQFDDSEQVTVQAMNNANVLYLSPTEQTQQYQGAFLIGRDDVQNPRLLLVPQEWEDIPLELRIVSPSSWAAQILTPTQGTHQYHLARDLVSWAQQDQQYSWFRACRTPDEIIQGTGEKIAASVIQFGMNYGGPIAVISKMIEGYQDAAETLGILEFEEDITNCEGIYTAVIEPVDPRYRGSTGTLAFNTCVRELPNQESEISNGCEDYIDNDCDQLIDSQDPDCFESLRQDPPTQNPRTEITCESSDLLCDAFSAMSDTLARNPPWDIQYGMQRHTGTGFYELDSTIEQDALVQATFQRTGSFRSSIRLEHQGEPLFLKLIAQEGTPSHYLSTRFNSDGTGGITCWDNARIAARQDFRYDPNDIVTIEHFIDSHASFMTINEETFEFGARCFTDTEFPKLRFEQRSGPSTGRTRIDYVKIRATLEEF